MTDVTRPSRPSLPVGPNGDRRTGRDRRQTDRRRLSAGSPGELHMRVLHAEHAAALTHTANTLDKAIGRLRQRAVALHTITFGAVDPYVVDHAVADVLMDVQLSMVSAPHEWSVEPAIDRKNAALMWVWHNRASGASVTVTEGAVHRTDGWPAVIGADGSRAWFAHGRPHRRRGPAAVLPDRTRAWYQRGVAQAIRFADGTARDGQGVRVRGLQRIILGLRYPDRL